MAFLTLGTGEVVLFDDEDEERVLAAGPWHRHKNRSKTCRKICKIYVRSSTRTYLHRFVLGLSSDDRRVVDHINHNSLDNRKRNLRAVSNAVNCANRNGAPSNNNSGVRGVSWLPHRRRWGARIQISGVSYWVGFFKSLDEASEAVKRVRFEWWGHE